MISKKSHLKMFGQVYLFPFVSTYHHTKCLWNSIIIKVLERNFCSFVSGTMLNTDICNVFVRRYTIVWCVEFYLKLLQIQLICS